MPSAAKSFFPGVFTRKAVINTRNTYFCRMATSRKTIVITTGAGDAKKQKGEPGLLIDLTAEGNLPFVLDGILLVEDKQGKRLTRFPLLNESSLLKFNMVPKEIRTILFRCTKQALQEQTAWFREKNKDTDGESTEVLTAKNLLTFFYNQFQQLKPFAGMLHWFYTYIDPLLSTTAEIKKAAISTYTPKLHFQLLRTPSGKLRLLAYIDINGQSQLCSDFKQYGFLLRHRNEFFLLNLPDVEALRPFEYGGYIDQGTVPEEKFIRENILPLKEKYPVNLEVLLVKKELSSPPECLVRLSELNGSFLMIRLQWQYEEHLIDDDFNTETVIDTALERITIKRHQETEKQVRDMIRATSPRFRTQPADYCYLPFAEAEKNQWFIKFYRKLSEHNIPVMGMETLKHFRYNQNFPTLAIKRNTKEQGYIDLQFEVMYGPEKAQLPDIKKAMQFHQPFILLKDGSLGIIPEEWNKQYETLLRLGSVDKNTLRLSDKHWNLIDHYLGTEAGEKPILKKDFSVKWQQHQQNPGTVFQVPGEVKANLRDYQKAGFEWFCLLDEAQWGGCLADDMGLGKTLQTISFLRFLLKKYPGEKHLVVCPTSLMYNWEAELKKFTPDVTYTIYHGADRRFSTIESEEHSIVITSYGTIRSDIAKFMQHGFGYVFLDESHVIKNPDSLTARAVLQLNARNRIILSGTPIQNNTMDLYTQMQFINPGLLGNKAAFRDLFVQPIDKFGDAGRTAELRKLIHPFLLRRTKEQVATDLPAKTEIIQWCEMTEAQKRIYDTVKEQYRETLLGKVKEEGVGSSTVYILEGLTRLRQVCNAPQLVPGYEDVTDTPVKMEELLRSLNEIGEGHKALVFSQFTGMLKLIAQKLEEQGIPFLYLDGQTTAEHRQLLVKQFQENNEHPVFLISLKAGGVGLTLTAADYVYLVDPWWNPAAEQQAIDRTHRIGQQQKVFAYKMICRDSVEEKILHLQERKKSLSEELISEDSGFIKKLTEEDIAYLFG